MWKKKPHSLPALVHGLDYFVDVEVFFFFFVLLKVLKGSRMLHCECGECVLTFVCGLVVNTKRCSLALTEVLQMPVHLEL